MLIRLVLDGKKKLIQAMTDKFTVSAGKKVY
jgi:hypothetical protein